MIANVDPNTIVYLNGDYTRLADAKVSVLDRGFIFGDGIYDVVPAYKGQAFRMDEHLGRLERSLKLIGLEVNYTRQDWEKLVLDMLARVSQGQDCMVYLHVTRGAAKRDHAFPANATPTVFCMVTPFERPSVAREKGLTAISIPDVRWLMCHIKSISLLGNVLARQQAVDAGVDEVIQFRDGYMTEGSSTNIWVVKDGVLLAPPRDNLILEGIRYRLLEELAAKAGIPFEARPISEAEVEAADELLLTSATKEVLPILQYNGKPVGTGQLGPVYQALRAGYDQILDQLEG
ncbi:D-amino acid aminotransferase [uncultured Paenalcaligenes sp.]|uniref:D-amino acid aminotransferase n=1 Tax=uncultured Paenalcaligenes sp. TaxID=1588925 RepID=UPI00260799CE|nr:D-amino acid aminotransferase [uncultured Paenalcaligenes sp.]